jgi:hypothetical protein
MGNKTDFTIENLGSIVLDYISVSYSFKYRNSETTSADTKISV